MRFLRSAEFMTVTFARLIFKIVLCKSDSKDCCTLIQYRDISSALLCDGENGENGTSGTVDSGPPPPLTVNIQYKNLSSSQYKNLRSACFKSVPHLMNDDEDYFSVVHYVHCIPSNA